MATQQSSFTRPHVAGAVAPSIKPIPATPQTPEIAPSPAPPETATRTSRQTAKPGRKSPGG